MEQITFRIKMSKKCEEFNKSFPVGSEIFIRHNGAYKACTILSEVKMVGLLPRLEVSEFGVIAAYKVAHGNKVDNFIENTFTKQ